MPTASEPPQDLRRVVRVFVSGPGDVTEERRVIQDVINEINRTDGPEFGFILEPWVWDKNALPDSGQPQKVIDQQTPQFEVYVGVMAHRFGTPTGDSGSGTEHEFREALHRKNETGRPHILFYFRNRPPAENPSSKQVEQWLQVLRFREEVQKAALVTLYDQVRGGPESFEQKVAEHLRLCVRNLHRAQPVPRPAEPERRWALVITSRSRRRRDLLMQVGLREDEDFHLESVYFTSAPLEHRISEEEARHLAVRNATVKLQSFFRAPSSLARYHEKAHDTLVVGVDTLVYCDGQILDKPYPHDPKYATAEEIRDAQQQARRMLESERGQTVLVITGLAVARATAIHLAHQGNLAAVQTACTVTQAKLRDLPDRDIESYVATFEPLDKAGAFGIQERGVMLFENIFGSYSNVVGLPLVDLFSLICKVAPDYRLPPRGSQIAEERMLPGLAPALSVVSIGDINFDFTFDSFPPGTLKDMEPPGVKAMGKIGRQVGGAAVNFAKHARECGFRQCGVVGYIGSDFLGIEAAQQLSDLGIEPLLPPGTGGTSVAIILRDKAAGDTSISVTDARQGFHHDVVDIAGPKVSSADVVYVSGYCLTDPNRRQKTAELIRKARRGGALVVLDVVVGMNKALRYEELISLLEDNVDVLVSETREVLRWTGTSVDDTEGADWEMVRKRAIPELRQRFPTLFLRSPDYTEELVVTPQSEIGPRELDYPRLEPDRRRGYADKITAEHLRCYLSPRILLASGSPRRLQLLHQIVARNKVVVRPMNVPEVRIDAESAESRVCRLAREKAEAATRSSYLTNTIELVIAADTEIVDRKTGRILAAPSTSDEARECLRALSGRPCLCHTGIAIIGKDARTHEQKVVVECVSTALRMRKLSIREIEDYVATGEPIGKAGSLTLQGRGELLVESIRGSHSNVIGFPLERFCQILETELGRSVWQLDRTSGWQAPLALRS